MTRERVIIEKRKPLTRAEFGQLMIDQEGRCDCGCGLKLQPMGEGVIDEHRVPLALGGTNDLSNRHLFRKPCAKAKTSDRDTPAIAKVKRIEARLNGTRRPRKPIPSPGFDKTKSRGFDGKVRARTTPTAGAR
ncbi:hypothetical protein [Brevundimonas pondensis]|uniref:HNH endonuclease n=1 Tax=Brevundimonas pondensis TaxID=2774189 RepID=A0ABX7SK52_9CAUL|nr:hypothetical protein [Brevundimonas pondensis]QTC88069.1 hypothetical protein IFE19_01285 [Brevundimonas pondensis]